jgi:replicative DNA helicase
MSILDDTQRGGTGRRSRAAGAAEQPATEFEGMRTPPHNFDAEQAVLGGMMLSKDAIADVIDKIVGEDFYRPNHASVFAAICDLYGRGEPADAVTVAGELDRRGLLARIGGAPYLLDLIQCVPTAANAGYYASVVAEKSTLRRLVQAGTRVVSYGYSGADGADIDQVVDAAQAEVYNVTENRRTTNDFTSMTDLMQETLDGLETDADATGVSTGFYDLDALTHGLHPGQLIVIGARPGAGKSTLAMDFLRACAIKQGKPAVIFSLEMSKDEIMHRLISAQANVKLNDLRGHTLSDNDWTRIAKMMADTAESPLYIDDSPNLTMMEIRAKARRMKQKHGLSLIVVDYLQLMGAGGGRYQSREQEVAEYSRSLKLLAKEVGVPVVALSQLNRKAEERHDKRPQLSDLRESGSVEQDADVVILIHRPDLASPDDPRAGEVDLIVAKHRNGRTATVTVCAQLHMARHADMARTENRL